MAAQVRTVEFLEHTIPILGPEHLVVCKVVFDRAKDWLDIAQVLTLVEGFDTTEVDRWLAEVLATDDRRPHRFTGLVEELIG
jgi:hypothetical protein